MRTPTGNDRRHALQAVHLGASGGPISLLLLPKCPLCLTPLLAFLGIVVAPSMGLVYVTAGILVAAWLSVLLVFSRRQPLIRYGALILAIASGFAIAAQSRALIWLAASAMAAVGVMASRGCTAGRVGNTVECS